MAGTRSVGFVFEEEVTSLDGVTFFTPQDNRYYNLKGQRVENTVHGGIYIQNVKKIVIR